MLTFASKPVILSLCFLHFVVAKPTAFRDNVSPQSSSVGLVHHEGVRRVPPEFDDIGPANQSTVIRMRASLLSSNMSGLEAELYAVSDPSSPRYRQHLSKAQVEEFVKPTQDTLTAVTQWLTSNGIAPRSASPAADILEFEIPISKANSLLNADYHVFVHSETGQQSFTTMAYSIPANLKGSLALVHPGTSFSFPGNNWPPYHHPPPPHPMPGTSLPFSSTATQRRPSSSTAHKPISSSSTTNGLISSSTVGAGTTSSSVATISSTAIATPTSTGAAPANSSVSGSCDTSITPACLIELYGLPTDLPDQPNNIIGVSAFNFQFAGQADLRQFISKLRPDFAGKSFNTVLVDSRLGDPQGNGLAGDEANLDIQYTVGVASGVNVTFFTVGAQNGTNGADQFIALMDFLLAQEEVPTVMTTSYGNDEDLVSPAVANQLCNAVMQLGVRGTSMLFSSGDGGVGGSSDNKCTTFVPTFPAGCPFLTSVGSTEGIAETGAEFSAGGFSNVFSQPSYQTSQVSAYLNLSLSSNPNASRFNSTGRAFPDVSAQGVEFEYILNGKVVHGSGTSASSPVFASVIGMLNSELIAAGKPPLGFLNPMLYQNAAALNDITTGNNPGCGTDGFFAASGWDPVTGLGTPNYAKLRAAVGL